MLLAPPALVQDAPLPALTAPPSPTLPDAKALSLDLAAALSRAKTENPQLKAARARVDERRGLITATRADAFPQVTLVTDVTRARDISGMGLAPFLHVDPSTMVSTGNAYTTKATLEQPLFHWGKIGTAIEIAKMGEKEAGYAYTTAELDTLHGVARAYLGVLSAQAELEVVAARQVTAEQFLEDVKAKLEAQTATELDRLRAESEYLAVVPETLQAEANYQRAQEVLNGQLNLDPKTPLRLADMGAPATDSRPAAQERSEIADYKQQEAMYAANDTIIKSDLRPKFDFAASYGYQTGAVHDQFQEPFDTWRVSVTMRFPVFDGLRSAGKRAQNNAQLEQVRQLRISAERDIAVEQSTAERELKKSIAFNDAARKAHEAGLEALRMSRESFDQGLITSLDVLQAERTERQLESQRRQAELGVWSALFAYRRSLGLPPL